MVFYSAFDRMICFIFLLLVHLSSVSSQTREIPLHSYPMSNDIVEGLAQGKMKISKAAQYYSYIGEYQAAASVPHEVKLEWGFDSLRDVDREYFKQFTPKLAVESIIERAGKEQIVMVNEAHHKPAHRVFTRRLLKGLYAQGFRYFGLETLSNCAYLPKEFCDDQLNERGYPYNSPITGTYVTEPQMGNLIRDAIEVGFTIFAYEKFGKDREQRQAHYIAKLLEKDPTAKILIQCGWYHLLEAPNNGKTWMATHLQQLTGIDPFTIYQDILVERPYGLESPFYSMMNFDRPMVFVNDAGQFYNGFKDFDLYDALVYHPRTTYKRNRPQWLVEYGEHTLYNISRHLITVSYPCLIKAFKMEEPNSAVPVDIIQREYAADPTDLVLPPGKYRLIISNSLGEQQELEGTVVHDDNK